MFRKIVILTILLVTSLIIYSCDNAVSIEDNALKRAWGNDTISIDTTLVGTSKVVIIKYKNQKDTVRDTVYIGSGKDTISESNSKQVILNLVENYTMNDDFQFLINDDYTANCKIKITYKLGVPTIKFEIKASSKQNNFEASDKIREEFVKEIEFSTKEIPLLTGIQFDNFAAYFNNVKIVMQSRDNKKREIKDELSNLSILINAVKIKDNKIESIEVWLSAVMPTYNNIKYKNFALKGVLLAKFD